MAASTSLFAHIHRLVAPSAEHLASDAELLRRFVDNRDQAAFAAVVARHGPMVLRLCRRVLDDAHAAEDACQATFLLLARKAASIRQPEMLAAWLHGVAYRLALKARAADVRRRQIETQRLQNFSTSQNIDPLAEVSGRELMTILDAELQRLPERYRLPLILCCLEGRSQPEAARLLGWSPGSVKGRLERGRAKLHQRLLRRGLTLSSALLALETMQRTASGGLPALLNAAILRAASSTETGSGFPTAVLVLAEGSVGCMVSIRAKLVSVLVLMVGILAGGFGALAYPHLPARQEAEKQTAGANAPAKKSDVPRTPRQKPSARTDRYGDPLPPGVLVRFGTIRLRRGSTLFRLPQRDAFLSISHEEANTGVCVWRMSTGELQRRSVLPLTRICAALSPDGTTLAIGGADQRTRTFRVLFWDVISRKVTSEMTPADGVIALAFAPDGKTLATSEQGQTLRLWDWRRGTELRRIKGIQTNCYHLAAR